MPQPSGGKGGFVHRRYCTGIEAAKASLLSLAFLALLLHDLPAPVDYLRVDQAWKLQNFRVWQLLELLLVFLLHVIPL